MYVSFPLFASVSTEVVSLGKADRSDVVIAGKISNAVQSLSVRIRLRCEGVMESFVYYDS